MLTWGPVAGFRVPRRRTRVLADRESRPGDEREVAPRRVVAPAQLALGGDAAARVDGEVDPSLVAPAVRAAVRHEPCAARDGSTRQGRRPAAAPDDEHERGCA